MLDLNSLPLDRLYSELARSGLVARLLAIAAAEDLGDPGNPAADVTTAACGIGGGANAIVRSRGAGVLAGMAPAAEVAALMAPNCSLEPRMADGAAFSAGSELAVLSGHEGEVLRVERTLLNLLSRLAGIATRTAAFVRAIREGAPGSRSQLFDTRKTTPGLRALEKYAVRCGGGMCHRLGLYDAVLIKDNHLAHVPEGDIAKFVEAAAKAARERSGPDGLRFIEVEVDSLSQLERILTIEPGLVDIALLDNMSIADLRAAVGLRDGAGSPLLLEASGGVTLDTVAEIARTGVDRISVGSITQSAPAVDIGLDFR